MRRMYSKKQVEDIAKASVSSGTKLYRYEISIVGADHNNRGFDGQLIFIDNKNIDYQHKYDYDEDFTIKQEDIVNFISCTYDFNGTTNYAFYMFQLKFDADLGKIMLNFMKVDENDTYDIFGSTLETISEFSVYVTEL